MPEPSTDSIEQTNNPRPPLPANAHPPFTSDDYLRLADAAQMLNLASHTLAAMGNVEPAIRQNAAELEQQVGGVVLRVRAAVASSSADEGEAIARKQPVQLGGAA